MEYTVTLRTSHLVFVARIIQIIFSTSQLAFAITLSFWTGNWGYYYYSIPLWGTVPIISIATMLMLASGIGMFAYKRPNDVHWHLMLSLDWLAFAGVLTNAMLSILIMSLQAAYTLPFYILLLVSTWVFLFALLVPIIRTHRLRVHKLLPPPNSPKESWYHMENEPRSPPHSPYATYTTPPAPVQSNFRRSASRAETTVRWSGVSGADTTVFPNVRSEASVVPPYSMSMGKEVGAEREEK